MKYCSLPQQLEFFEKQDALRFLGYFPQTAEINIVEDRGRFIVGWEDISYPADPTKHVYYELISGLAPIEVRHVIEPQIDEIAAVFGLPEIISENVDPKKYPNIQVDKIDTFTLKWNVGKHAPRYPMAEPNPLIKLNPQKYDNFQCFTTPKFSEETLTNNSFNRTLPQPQFAQLAVEPPSVSLDELKGLYPSREIVQVDGGWQIVLPVSMEPIE